MKRTDKIYLMLAGTFLPAFIGISAYSVLFKKNISMKSAEFLLIFAAMSSIGGYSTAKMIKKYEDSIPKQ